MIKYDKFHVTFKINYGHMKKLYNILALLLTGFITSGSFGQNTAPVAVTDTFETKTNWKKFFKPLNNDFDVNGDSIFMDSVHQINPNKATVKQVNNIFEYTPDSSFLHGTDTLFYRICDDGSPKKCDWGNIFVNVKYKQYPVSEYLETNNIRAIFNSDGNLFQNRNNAIAGFEFPKGSGKHCIYAADIWMGGKYNGTVKTALGNYIPARNIGPTTDTSFIDPDHKIKWNKLWRVKKQEIDSHIQNYKKSSYSPPSSLTDWPAHGNTSKGQGFHLAPFLDINYNKTYQLNYGDFPLIGGKESLYFMFNTKHKQSADIEVHGMGYGFNCSGYPELNNTVFVKYRIINKSNQTYDSTYFGLWTDPDLGLASDDYIGCNVDESYYYGYNGTAYDPGGNGVNGYGKYPPAVGVAIIKGPKMDSDGKDNAFGIGQDESINGHGFGDGIVDNEHWGMEHFMYYNMGPGTQGDPQTPEDHYNYIRGKWRDGAPMTYGGNGHSTGMPCKFMFPGSSDTYHYGTGGVPQQPWTEQTAGNTPGDRRGVASTGPITLKPGESKIIEVAYVVAQDTTDTTVSSDLKLLEQYFKQIKKLYYQNAMPCGGRFMAIEKPESKPSNNLSIYPNPHSNQFTIELGEAVDNAELIIRNSLGQVLKRVNFSGKSTIVQTKMLKKGIYLVEIRNNDFRLIKKIIKN